MKNQNEAERIAAGVAGPTVPDQRVVLGPDNRRWCIIECPGTRYILPDNGRHDGSWDHTEPTEPTESDRQWLEDYYKTDAGPTDPRK